MNDVFPFNRVTDRYRVVLAVEYNGGGFHGWQIQRSGVATVQAALEAAIAKVADEQVATLVAGRTDAGVHATNQIVHFDTRSERSEYGWKMGINGYLPAQISVRWVSFAEVSFHARFSAIERVYRYVIHNSWVRSALLHPLTAWEQYPLDIETMQNAVDGLLGTHDFSSFRSAECQAHSPVRTLKEFKLRRFNQFVVAQVRADGFLHHMVRNLVGVLLPVGRGRKPLDWPLSVLHAQDRRKAGVTAAASGLYFVRAKYHHASLPKESAGPDFIEPLLGSRQTDFDEV